MTNGKDSAFAHVTEFGSHHPGLTKREYFAAMAMQGICSNGDAYNNYDDFADVANAAVQNADALIEALNKEQSK